ncbi:RIP metalloprotease RseP [Haloimpatiens sp. FM7315]|uniref:RIP metalloprotease RseP n=1 Tax=Haloimpatiens sp. FM7315 TaxID=3298609 RepID=UPI0035A2BA1D
MNIIYLLLAFLAFSILIIGHELGHFVVAKLNNVMVEEFSVGMGPKIFGIKKKETEYCLRAIPIGGFVKMLGEQGEDSKDPRAFSNKKPIQRMSIALAGPIMNFILAIVFFAIIGCVNGVPTSVISKIENNSPAYNAGVLAGDKITEVNGEKISNWNSFIQAINEKNGGTINLTLNRGNTLISKRITPLKLEKENRYIIGVSPSIKKIGLSQGVVHGISEVNMLTKETFKFLGNLFKKKVSMSGVGGPISVMRISTKAAKAGILTLVNISAYISVQLAIFNLLPIPALDGGWILISIVEMIIGKKLNEEKVAKVTYAGFVLLISLAVVVTVKDILYPLKL